MPHAEVNQETYPLIFADMLSTTASAVLTDVMAEVDPPVYEILVAAQVDAEVLGVMCEMQLNGFKPEVGRAIFAAGVHEKVYRTYHERFDPMHLSATDINTLAVQVQQTITRLRLGDVSAHLSGVTTTRCQEASRTG